MNNRSKAPPHATKYWPFQRKTDKYTILNTYQKLTLGSQKLTWGLILQRKGGGGISWSSSYMQPTAAAASRID